MTRYLKTPVTQLSANESAALQQINKNLDDIQSAIQDTVSRSGNSPTQMTADLDLNGKRIINAPAPLTDNDFVRRVDVVGDIATVQSLVNAASTAAGQAIAAAEGVQEAIADAHVGIVADDLMLGDDSKIRIAANNIDDITACVSDISDIQAVGGNISNVNAVADNETNINAVNTNKTNIDAVAGNATNINAVAGVSSDVTTVAGISSNVSSVASNATNINTCASNMEAITGASTQATNAANSALAAAASAQAAAISAAGTHFKLFQHGWFDYQLNDMAWLRADTFSWQDGTVYTNAYNHLVADYNGGNSQTETVGSYTITYILATDGHKITTDETNVANIYNESGVAWYYILDTVNQRFKLPRTKYGFTGLRDAVGKYVPESLPNITGTAKRMWFSGGNGSGSGAFLANGNAGNTWGFGGQGAFNGYYTESFDASISSSTYQNNAPVQQRSTQMYLYFYVGNYTQSATEQTAGLNSELFNGKMDLDLGNVTQAAKETIVGWGMPKNTKITLTPPSSGVNQEFTAPSDGYFVLSVYGGSNEDFFVWNKTRSIGYHLYTATASGSFTNRLTTKACKGDKVDVFRRGVSAELWFVELKEV